LMRSRRSSRNAWPHQLPNHSTADLGIEHSPRSSDPMHIEKRILLSWYIDPRYIAPFTLSDAQMTVGPQLTPHQPQLIFAAWTPIGTYDLKAALTRQGTGGTDFDLIVVIPDVTGTNMPLNHVQKCYASATRSIAVAASENPL
jgi:hypothetical protein